MRYRLAMRRLTHLIILTAFIFSCGGQWAAFQCVAWANMIREYSEMVPMAQAVEMTFSGQYPCAICKAIAEKKNSEQQKTFLVGKADKKFLPVVSLKMPVAIQSVSVTYFDRATFLVFRSDAPAIPPPRLALS
jgi:hypothetical protein